MTSYRIWVPSKQTYIRMYEISCEQYRNILKTIDDDFDFEFSINSVLIENLYDKTVNLQNFTIIDKFTIILQLKVHSCNSNLNLTRICDKCDTKTDFSIDLNSMIDSLAISIDKSFEEVIHFNSIDVTCDVPAINFIEEFLYDKNDHSARLDDYMYSFIKYVNINGNFINLNKMSRNDKIKICESLPFEIMIYIKNNFIDTIHTIFKDLLIVSIPCSNDVCKDTIVMNFDVNHMTDIIRILFRDTSSINMLGQYAGISNNYHLGYSFYKNICPSELDILYNMISKTNKSSDNSEDYSSKSDTIVESPSEFE